MGSLFCCNKHCRLYFSRSLALRSIKSAPPSMSKSAARMYSVIGKKRCTAPSGSLTRASRKACKTTSDMPAIHAIESRKKRCVRQVMRPDRTRFPIFFGFFISLLLSPRLGRPAQFFNCKHQKKRFPEASVTRFSYNYSNGKKCILRQCKRPFSTFFNPIIPYSRHIFQR